MRVIICDDEPSTVEMMRKYLIRYCPDMKIMGCGSGEELLEKYVPCDVVFLDIDMKGINGIETARRLRGRDRKVPIIYVTGYNDYMDSAFSVHAFGYLQKPVSQEQIFRQLDEVRRYAAVPEPAAARITLETEEGVLKLRLDEISYFEYFCRKILVHTSKAIYHMHGSISSLAERMRPLDFAVPHKSFVVNLGQVRAVRGYDIHLMDGSIVPLSQKKSSQFRGILNRYLAEHI